LFSVLSEEIIKQDANATMQPLQERCRRRRYHFLLFIFTCSAKVVATIFVKKRPQIVTPLLTVHMTSKRICVVWSHVMERGEGGVSCGCGLIQMIDKLHVAGKKIEIKYHTAMKNE
jgi:hypothetical protein